MNQILSFKTIGNSKVQLKKVINKLPEFIKLIIDKLFFGSYDLKFFKRDFANFLSLIKGIPVVSKFILKPIFFKVTTILRIFGSVNGSPPDIVILLILYFSYKILPKC